MKMLYGIALACLQAGGFLGALAAEQLPAEKPAVAAVETLGCGVTFDAEGHATEVTLANCPTTDADLALLAGLPRLSSLEVWGAEITDAGMESIGRMAALKKLTLENTDVTDTGAEQLASLASLEVLNLRRSSNMSDAALKEVAKIADLQQLILLYTEN